MDFQTMTVEERDRRRSRAYHAACEAQYIAAAANLIGKMKEKALNNAKWHSDQIAALDKRPTD